MPDSYETLARQFGLPERFSIGLVTQDGASLREGLRFPCGCEAMNVGEFYELGVRCEFHVPKNPDAVSIALTRFDSRNYRRLSDEARELLKRLVKSQQHTGRDAPKIFRAEDDGAAELVEAGIATIEGGTLRLRLFTIWDPTARAWI